LERVGGGYEHFRGLYDGLGGGGQGFCGYRFGLGGKRLHGSRRRVGGHHGEGRLVRDDLFPVASPGTEGVTAGQQETDGRDHQGPKQYLRDLHKHSFVGRPGVEPQRAAGMCRAVIFSAIAANVNKISGLDDGGTGFHVDFGGVVWL
jgi:hypothetical protein